MPPANAFIPRKKIAEERRFPLRLAFCLHCSLVQLREVVDPRILFASYVYLTGASAPLVTHFKTYADAILRSHCLKRTDLVVEIGSNDGTLLSFLKGTCRVVGIDPAKNVAALANKKGIPTLCGFFNEDMARRVLRSHGKATVVIANNVFAHIDDVHEVLQGVRALLTPDGVYVCESHWVGNLIGEGGFDQIYHEHLSYYSLHALRRLGALYGLSIVDAQLVPMHGESLRVTFAVGGKPSARVDRLLAREKRLGLTQYKTYQTFAIKAAHIKAQLKTLVRSYAREGKRIAGYGAPAKGNTLLNYAHLGPREVQYLTDTTPLKQGLYSPGMHIPVVAPDHLWSEMPDYVLLLAWNYRAAILKKEKALREGGVKFILPAPSVRVV